jgi:hypothetical protein
MNRRLMLGLAPVALALATVAHAQPPGPPAGGPHVVMMHGGQPSAEMKAAHEAMMKQHLEDLKTVLRLRPDQEGALQAFVAAHHPEGGMPMMMHGGMHGPDEGKAMTTPERLAEMAKHESAMAAEHEKQRQALAKFYAALSPDQQKVFDALQRLHGGPMGGHDGPGMRRIMIRGPGGGPMPGHDPD